MNITKKAPYKQFKKNNVAVKPVEIPLPEREYTSPLGKIITFNDQQYEALIAIRKWIRTPKDLLYTLSGYAGTGKTTLVNAAIYDHKSVVVSAPTHKAKIVVAKATGREGQTIQALLGLKPNTDLENFDIENPQFDPLGQKLIGQYKLVVIDEASMLSKDLFSMLCKEATLFSTKLLFMGDMAQLPPVNEFKSEVFNVKNLSQLTKVERQKSDNPLMKVYDSIRDNIQAKDDVFEHTTQMLDNQGITFYHEEQSFRERTIQAFISDKYKADKNYVKMICYTNRCVKEWNNIIREAIIGKNQPILVPGDLLMAYSTIMLTPNQQLYNSADYEVMSIHNSESKEEIATWTVNLRDIDTRMQYTVYFVVPEQHNHEKFRRVAEALMDNAMKSTGKLRSVGWAQYFQFKSKHLLMQKVGRIDKDFDYGYAITVHKSQGSTYTNVFVDESDIDTCRKYTERNKLKYVAFSRPTDSVHSLINTMPIPKQKTDTEKLQELVSIIKDIQDDRVIQWLKDN